MKCPECNKEMKKGEVKASGGTFSEIGTTLRWIPDESKRKFFKKGAVSLHLYGKGWYCDECMKVFAAFDER